MTAVLDTSLLAHALIRTQLSLAARAELRTLLGRRERLVAPVSLASEFATAVRRLESRDIVAGGEADSMLRQFAAFPVELLWNPAWIDAAYQMARSLGASGIYDTLFLACAEDLDADLYTCDARFVRSFGSDVPDRVRLVEV